MPALTTSVKDEICHVYPHNLSSMVAELSSMFRFAGGLHINGGIISTSRADSPWRHPSLSGISAESLFCGS